MSTTRKRLAEILQPHKLRNKASNEVDLFPISLIFLNVLDVIMESASEFHSALKLPGAIGPNALTGFTDAGMRKPVEQAKKVVVVDFYQRLMIARLEKQTLMF